MTDQNMSDAKPEYDGHGALDISLHPLVIINISDHQMRVKAQTTGAGPSSSTTTSVKRIMGALLGTQNGREVEIYTSFELLYDIVDDTPALNMDYLKAKQEQFKKVFPQYDILGWYATGADLTDDDMTLHRAITAVNESPLFLLMDTEVGQETLDLPINIYESELHIVDGVITPTFAKTRYKIETLEAERISVDHVAKLNPNSEDGGESMLSGHLQGISSAVTMLETRIRLVGEVMKLIKEGVLPHDHAILRHAAAISHRIPTVNTKQFEQEFLTEHNDALLATYLAVITKGTSQVDQVIDKFNMSHDKMRHKRGMMF
eukprot:GFYU01003103.1.p1 GENE.GFYU01003103.1~~GFYU01003103.1.p1  ORF type:complete len:330 (+),score=72.38 GFYU01003103.1:37-990(+)